MAAAVLAMVAAGGLGVAAVVWIQRALMFPAPRAAQPSEAVAAAGGRPVWLDHAGGRTEAWYLPARRAGAGGALLYAHGNGELIDHWLEEWEPLRDAGLAVLLVEYPGYGRSSGRPSAATIGAAMRAAYDWLVRQPGIDAKRIAAYGRSLGGGAVCLLAGSRDVAALVLESTFTSVADIARGRGFPGFVVVERFESRAVVERFRGPILILHGESDGVIPVSHARRLHEAAPQSELHTFACGHNDCPRPGALLRTFLTRSGVLDGDS
jgi:pimeloyl-ACP methyl ester carboxylesterase